MRAVFFGTPALAVPALRALATVTDVAGVVCQPDRPAGRGLALSVPPVKTEAERLGLPVHQPQRVRDGSLRDWLAGTGADLAVVLAYGRILPPDVLATPRLGCVNLHASLLPKLRGAAPVQWALITGETETGISLMQMDAGLDTGPVFTRHSLSIGPDETAGELAERIAQLAAAVVLSDIPRLGAGELTAEPQDATLATHAPPLGREHGRIDWHLPSRAVHDLIRGLSPRPGAYTTHRGKALRVRSTARIAAAPALAPGELRVERPKVLIGTGDGALELVTAQVEGRRELPALELVNGRALADGERLGT
ncbi:MAG TPA: methionyl-tRNA formyltransferase [Polyangiaceae bacterium]